MRRPEVWGPVGLLLGVVLLGGVGMVFFSRLLGLAAGPEAEIITRLKESEAKGLELPMPPPGPPLRSTRHQYERLQVGVNAPDRSAVVSATLDFNGTWGRTAVSSLGFERIAFENHGGTWRPVETLAPRLRAVVLALERRRAALEQGDWATLLALYAPPDASSPAAGPEADSVRAAQRQLEVVHQRRYRVHGWFIRSEREEVLVREEYQLTGELPDRPIDELGARNLTLIPISGGEFFFSGGLM